MIISEEQGRFVTNSDIHNNILLAQELTQALDRKIKDNNLMINIDMSKAFDKLSWNFLDIFTQKFGFQVGWIDMIRRCISNSWFSVIINGESQGYFHSGKGVRQGDSISPSLFIIAEEYFIRGLKHVFNQTPS
ncbi:hypothetical protein LIER_38739 [Lithospermum erythrorhizon]|uniref:Reverse transcriptase domain-containing protein n=1 Tax=Lithospermum erythrorhizon TaxID=34254 RepID=A0AAV3Q6Q4_LITER